jgi:hypothetical protein
MIDTAGGQETMVFTSKALLTISALAPAAFAIPGPSWFRRQTGAQDLPQCVTAWQPMPAPTAPA